MTNRIFIVLLMLVLTRFSLAQEKQDSLFSIWMNPSLHIEDRLMALEDLMIDYQLIQFSDSSLSLSQTGLELALTEDDDLLVAKAYFLEALALSAKGDFLKSNKSLLKSKEVFEREDLKEELAKVHLQLGSNYKAFGDYKNSLEHYLHSSNLFNQLGDDEGVAEAENKAGKVHMIQSQYDQAESKFERARNLFKKNENLRGAARALKNLGDNFKLKGDFPQAEIKFRESITLSLANEYKKELAQAYSSYSEVLIQLGQKDLALDYQKGALELYEELKMKKELASSYVMMMAYYNERNLYRKAIEKGKIASIIINEIGEEKLRTQVYLESYKAYKKMSQTSLALEMHEKYLDAKLYSDSLQQGLNVQRIQMEEYHKNKMEFDSLRSIDHQLMIETSEAKAATDLENEKIITYSLLIVLGTILILGGLVFNRMQVIKKQELIILGEKSDDLKNDRGESLNEGAATLQQILTKYYKQESERLQFRQLKKEDFEAWRVFFEDNSRERFLGLDSELSAEEKTQQWIDLQLERYEEGDFGHLAIVERKSGALVGVSGLLVRNKDSKLDYEVAYSILPEYWGKGYATEAALHMKVFAQEHDLHERVVSWIHPENVYSQNVAKKNGMVFRGEQVEFRGIQVDVWEAIL